MPHSFFTNQSFFTLAGASAIVFVVCNALQSALNFNPKWLALVLAELVALYGTHASQNALVPSDYFLAALNGCLIYCTAVGGTTIAGSSRRKARPKGLAIDSEDPQRRDFTTSWF
jgi:hypothetical protein